MSRISQTQTQKLLQKLSPQQIQMIKLLELPTMQFEQRIKQEIEENPILDDSVTENTENEEGEESNDVDIDIYDDTPSYKYYANNTSKDDNTRTFTMAGGLSLHEYLIQQLGFRQLSDEDNLLASYIIGSLDNDGYLRRDMISVVDDIAFNLGIETTTEHMEYLLSVIHQLEPVGIGARNLQECLLLQLHANPLTTRAQRLACTILTSYFDEFSKKHYEKLMDKLNVDEDEFRDAIEEITRLSPRPGNLYNEGDGDASPYIVPDFQLDYQNGEFFLSMTSYNVPELRISRHYMEMIKEMQSGKKMNEEQKEVMSFIKGKIESAKWFMSAIKQRRDTLMLTMNEILDYQREYFVDGDETKLRPMILKDIADRTNLDVSTISRVVNSKYIQTHFGILSLKQLFSEAMQTDTGEEVSSHEIKKILSDCVSGEDKHKPLTDEVLMEVLNDKGYRIARRTVAKYREMLGIPVARLRKEI